MAGLCQRLGVELLAIDFDVEAYITSHSGISTEMACRELRYQWFFSLLAERNATRIATGHNANDNEETLLLNLLRGAGTGGLKGMEPDNGRIIRPLLSLSRTDIEDYLRQQGETHITDSTNLQSDYRRNFLRNEVLPLLRSRWEGTDTAISRAISNLRRENRIVEHAIKQALRNHGSEPGRFLSRKSVWNFADAHTLLFRFAQDAGFSSATAAEMAEAATGNSRPGREWKSATHRLIEERDGWHLHSIAKTKAATDGIFVWEEHDLTPALMAKIKSDRSNSELWTPYPAERYELRHPRTADRISPLGLQGSQLLSDVMKDAHLPRPQREELWIAADKTTGEIIWADSLKRSRHHLLTPAHHKAYRLRKN